MKIAFILDESSSIGTEFEPDVRQGVNAFLRALECTGAEISFIEFNSTARLVSVTNGSYQEIDDGLIRQVDNYFAGTGSSTLSSTYSPPDGSEDGWTNWEEALLRVDDLSSTPDLILFFTDGNPTAFNGGSSGGGDPVFCTNETSLTNAVVLANGIKRDSDDPHIFMLGVGTAIGETELQRISGSTEYNPGSNSIATSDWYVEESFNNLANCLRAFARSLCPLCPGLMPLNVACDSVPTDLFLAAGGTRSSDCGDINVDYSFTHPGACGGTQSVLFTITDNNGTSNPNDDLVEECSTMVTVRAAPAPAPLQCAGLPPISCSEAVMAQVSDYQPLTSSNGLTGECALTITGTPFSVNTMNLSCEGDGMILINYTVTDNCGGTYPDFQCMQTVTATPLPPQPSCPTLGAISCSQAEATVPGDYSNITSSNGTGSCMITKTGVPTSIDKSQLACDGSGMIVITYTVTDNCGNDYEDVVCEQAVTAAPVPNQPSCPSLSPLSCAAAAIAVVGDYSNIAAVAGTGICQITKTGVPSSIDKSGIACDGSGSITIVYTVTDNCGNSYANVECQQTVLAAPVPAQPTCVSLPELSCAQAEAAQLSNYANLSTMVGSGICQVIKTAVPSSINKDNLACDGGGSLSITYSVTDNCGNTYPDVICMQSVAPLPVPDQPSCPSLTEISCAEAADASPMDYSNITSSLGSGSCIITKTGTPASIDKSQIACDGSGVITITYTVTDNCGNTYADVLCDQSVTAAPVPDQPECPTLPSIGCMAAADAAPGDYADITSSAGSGSCMITKTGVPSSIDRSQLACDGSGMIVITYTVTDNCGNNYDDVECAQMVTAAAVPDQPACPTLSALSCAAAANAGVEDYSNISSTSGSGICQITKTGVPTSIDRSALSCDGSGSITIVYAVTDNCGNTYEDVMCQQSVIAAPVPAQPACGSLAELTCAEAAMVQLSDYSNLTSSLGSGSCQITKTAVPTSINKDNLACDGGGSILITYSVTDNCGNTYSDVVCMQPVAAVSIPDQPTCPDLDPISCAEAANVSLSDFSNITSTSGTGLCMITKTGVPSNIDRSQMACDGSGTITINYTVMDNCGNDYPDVVCELSVEAAPLPAQPACPTLLPISCTAASTAMLNDYGNITSTSGSGDCLITKTGVPSSIDKSQIACDGSGVIIISYTVTDNCGNSYEDVQCEQQVLAAPPATATQPNDITIDCDQAPPVGTVLNFSNGLSGACAIGGDVTGVITGSHTECGGSYVETWTFDDDCQEGESVVQRVISVRRVVPSFTTRPGDIELSCADLDIVEGLPTVLPTSLSYSNDQMGACNISGEVTSVITGSVDCCGGSVLLETWTYEYCNATQRSLLPTLSHSRTITILGDIDPPSIDVCPPDIDLGNISGEPTISDLPAPFEEAGLFMKEDNNVSIEEIVLSYSDSGPSQTGCVYTFERTYTLIDPCGQSSKCVQLMTITNDQSLPTLEGVPEDTIVSCDVSIEDIPWPSVSAQDQFGDQIAVNRQEVRGNAGCGGAFYERIFSTDGTCGNTLSKKYTIRFEDNVDPILNVPDDTTMACDQELPQPEYTASDNCSNVEVSFKEEVSEIGNCERLVLRTWTARDACGNTTTKTQSIYLKDFAPPVIRIVNPGMHGVEEGSEVVTYDCDPPQVSASDIEVADDCCVDISSLETFDRLVASHTCEVFGYFRKWICGYTVSDGVGNETSFTFYVLQYDTMAPQIQMVPADLDLPCGAAIPAASDSVSATDNCQDDLLEVDFTEDMIISSTDTSQVAIVRNWVTEDYCGNVSQAQQVITVCGFDRDALQRSIGNMVWLDVNGNGVQDTTEQGLDGVEVSLYQTDENGENKALWGQQITRSVGDQQGVYGFSDLPYGHYLVEVKVPAGLALTTLNQGSDRLIDSDFSGARSQSPLIHLQPESAKMDVDAGLILDPSWQPSFDLSGSLVAGCLHRLFTELSQGEDITSIHLQIANDDLYLTIDSVEVSSAGLARELTFDQSMWSPGELQSYRAKLVTSRGFVWYSDPIALDSDCRNSSALTFPNPTQSTLFFKSVQKIDRSDYRLVIRNAMGRTFVIKKGISFSTDHLLNIDLAELPPGHYTIQVSSAQSTSSSNFIKL